MTKQPTPRPKRLSLSEILEHLLTRSRSERSSVTLSRNASGETQIDVQVRTADDGEVRTVDDAAAKAQAIYDGLAATYPSQAKHDEASVALTRNAKGETQIDVKVPTAEGGSATTVDEAATLAGDTYDTLRARFPLASGYVGAAGEAEKAATS